MRIIAFVFSWLAIASIASAVGENGPPLERTAAAKRLLNAVVGLESRQALAKAINNYCTETARHLPQNSPIENEEIVRAMSGDEISRLQKVDGRKLSTWSFHKTLSDCQVLSAGILLKADKTSSAEAALWVRLEGALDQPEHTAISLGILLVDNNGDTISDLHGINFWPAARIAIRNSALLPLLQAK